jgi:hypothetical protein
MYYVLLAIDDLGKRGRRGVKKSRQKKIRF